MRKYYFERSNVSSVADALLIPTVRIFRCVAHSAITPPRAYAIDHMGDYTGCAGRLLVLCEEMAGGSKEIIMGKLSS